MSVKLSVAANCQPTGRILAELLRERGVELVDRNYDAVISYGLKYTGDKPALNANAGGRTKYDEMGILARAGINIVPTFKYEDGILKTIIGGQNSIAYPLLARAETHMHGKDIMMVLQAEDIPLRISAGASFFTQYVPRETEFRVWIYRRRVLGTYQKVMLYPDKYRFVGCNYRNGFGFKYVKSEDAPAIAVDLASKSVSAMQLDFGAVDILKGKDGKFYVLEVNTAPGVAGLTREGIKKLAAKMAKWVELGYVKRSER
jgi:hypothetical protein